MQRSVLVYAFIATALALVSVSRAQREAQLLTDCFNADATLEPGVFQDFLQGKPSRLHLRNVLWSTKAMDVSSGSSQLTVVTAATCDRLEALRAQCYSWPGPLSAAIYLPVQHTNGSTKLSSRATQQLEDAAAKVQALFKETEGSPDACALRVLLVYELVADELLPVILPVNSIRNVAMLAATTPLVAMVDVDLILSANLANQVLKDKASAERLARQCEEGRSLYILPAFETSKAVGLEEGAQLVEKVVRGGKQEVAALLRTRALIPFAQHVYVRGHNATDFPRWLSASEAYQVEYQANYEPWFVVLRMHSHAYDARFRGYGWNKVAQVSHMNATSFKFLVHPEAFLVHRPHEKSGAQGLYDKAAKGGKGMGSEGVSPAKLFHRKVAALRHVVIRDMRRGTYHPVTDAGSARCRKELPWWQSSTT